ARLRQSSPAVTPVLDSGAVLAGCGARPAHTLATSAPGFAHRSLGSGDVGGRAGDGVLAARVPQPASTAPESSTRVTAGEDCLSAARTPSPARPTPQPP